MLLVVGLHHEPFFFWKISDRNALACSKNNASCCFDLIRPYTLELRSQRAALLLKGFSVSLLGSDDLWERNWITFLYRMTMLPVTLPSEQTASTRHIKDTSIY